MQHAAAAAQRVTRGTRVPRRVAAPLARQAGWLAHVTGDGYIFAINHRANRAQGSPTGDWGERTEPNRSEPHRTQPKRNKKRGRLRKNAEQTKKIKRASMLTMTTKIAPAAVLGMSRLGLTCAISCQLSHNSSTPRRARRGT